MSDETTKTETPATPDAQAFPQCPRCGWSTNPALKPDEEDVKEYFRATLGKRVFTKTYDLAQGKIKMTFSTLTAASQAESERVAAGLDELTDRAANASGIRLRLLYHLRSIALDGADLLPFDYVSLASLDDASKAFDARFGSLPGPLLDMAARTLLLFMELNRELLAAAFDESFWKGAGPASPPRPVRQSDRLRRCGA